MSTAFHPEDHSKNDLTVGEHRLAGAAGILFFAWLVTAAIVYAGLLPLPTFADNAAYARAYFTDHAVAVQLHAWLSGLVWAVAFLVFAAALRRDLAGGGEAPTMWPDLAFGGALLTVAVGAIGLVFETVATSVAGSASDDLLLTLGRMVQIVDSTLLYWGLTVFVASASIAVLRSGRFGAWLAWLGFASAALMVVGALWPLTGSDRSLLGIIGLVGLTAVGVWVLLAALGMLRARTPEPAA